MQCMSLMISCKMCWYWKKEYAVFFKPSTNWSCFACLFPGPLLPDEPCMASSMKGKSAASSVKVRLLQGLKIAHLNVSWLMNKINVLKNYFPSIPLIFWPLKRHSWALIYQMTRFVFLVMRLFEEIDKIHQRFAGEDLGLYMGSYFVCGEMWLHE